MNLNDCNNRGKAIKKGANEMARYEIKCINKSDRDNRYESITHVGVQLANGTILKMSVAEVINYINNGNSFFVKRAGRVVDVEVVEKANGNKYIRTEDDDTKKDNLLSLPECL